MAAATCPWCNAPRVAEPSCPRCGANYAKAEQIKGEGKAALPRAVEAELRAEAVMGSVDRENSLDGVAQDLELEWKLCAAAIPAALACGMLFHLALPGLQRIFLGMPVHELGHATTAWFHGYWSIPTLWKALTAEARGVVTPLLLLGGLGYLIWRAQRAGLFALAALGAALIVVQGFCTFVVKAKTAESLIVWGGDGTGMLLATALMASFFFGKETQLYRGSLRWGFLVIGAGAFADMFGTWWKARTDYGAIPFGEMEGVGLSDPTRLVDDFGWTTDQVVHRYVVTGIVCLVALALVYAWGVRRALAAAKKR